MPPTPIDRTIYFGLIKCFIYIEIYVYIYICVYIHILIHIYIISFYLLFVDDVSSDVSVQFRIQGTGFRIPDFGHPILDTGP